MNHENDSVFLILILIKQIAFNFIDSWIDKLELLPFGMLSISPLRSKILFTLRALDLMLNFRFHIPSLISFIELPVIPFPIGAILNIIPLILIFLFSLFPSISSILILIIDIFSVDGFMLWLTKLWTWEDLWWLLLDAITFFYYWVATEYYGAWTVWFWWFWGTVRVLGFCVVAGTRTGGVAVALLGVEVFVTWSFVGITRFWWLSLHQSRSLLIISLKTKL